LSHALEPASVLGLQQGGRRLFSGYRPVEAVRVDGGAVASGHSVAIAHAA